MGIFYRKVGNVIFERTTSPGRDPLVEVTVGDVKVSILKDKKIFDAATFAAFCTEENAKHIKKEYVDPLLKWAANGGESAAYNRPLAAITIKLNREVR